MYLWKVKVPGICTYNIYYVTFHNSHGVIKLGLVEMFKDHINISNGAQQSHPPQNPLWLWGKSHQIIFQILGV